jgi:hypothetical protein
MPRGKSANVAASLRRKTVPNPLSFLPSLGMSGFYALAAPYDKLISTSAQYKCEGVKSLAAAIAEGQDPLKNVYLANGDSEANFKSDLARGISLVTISSRSGQLIVFPAGALLQVPLADGVVYRNTVLAVALGALPETQDFTELQEEVLQLVLNKFGINGATYLTTVNSAVVLTQNQHQAVMAAREAKIAEGESIIAQNASLQTQLTAALNKIVQLEQYIKSNLS